jgi:DNA-binding response OmpR family regulator
MPGTILIVDDERMDRETIESILDGQGYRLEFAEDGCQAIETAQTIHPDVILLDVMMPGLSGFEVCSIIRNSQLLSGVPIIFLTVLDDWESKLRGMQAGADDYIVKPCNRHELRARLKSLPRLNC